MNTTDEVPIEKLDYPKDIPYGHYSENGVITAYPDYGTLGEKKINLNMLTRIIHRLDGMGIQKDEDLFLYSTKMVGKEFSSKEEEKRIRQGYRDAIQLLESFCLIICGDGEVWHHCFEDRFHGASSLIKENIE